MKRINIIPLFLLILFFGCKSEQALTDKKLEKTMNLESFDYEYMTIKSKVEFINGDKEEKAAGYIRMKKDSVIWMTLSKTHVEGVRLLVTQDTFLMMNRIDKTYYSYSMEELKERFNFPFDFNMLQSAITGELYWSDSEIPEPTKTAQSFVLKGMIQELNIENHVSRKNNKLEKIMVSNKEGSKLEISYSDFEKVDDTKILFANKSNSVLNYKNADGNEAEIKLNLDFNKVKISTEPITFSFKISDKYKKIEL